MKWSNEEFKQMRIIEGISRQAYLEAGGELQSTPPAPDPITILPTKSTEDDTTPKKHRFYNDPEKNAKAEQLQELLNKAAIHK